MTSENSPDAPLSRVHEHESSTPVPALPTYVPGEISCPTMYMPTSISDSGSSGRGPSFKRSYDTASPEVLIGIENLHVELSTGVVNGDDVRELARRAAQPRP